jgi:hypothetical protein
MFRFMAAKARFLAGSPSPTKAGAPFSRRRRKKKPASQIFQNCVLTGDAGLARLQTMKYRASLLPVVRVVGD